MVTDQYGTPTSALELARTIIFLMETDSYGIYHATCEGILTGMNLHYALRERHNYYRKDWKDALHEYMCELDK